MYFRTGVVVEEPDAVWAAGLRAEGLCAGLRAGLRAGEVPFDCDLAPEVFSLANASLGGDGGLPLDSTGVSRRRWGGVGVSGVRGGLCSDAGIGVICLPLVHG